MEFVISIHMDLNSKLIFIINIRPAGFEHKLFEDDTPQLFERHDPAPDDMTTMDEPGPDET